MLSIQRINDFSLLKFVETQTTREFWKSKDELSLVNNQYFIDEDINNIIWSAGSSKYQYTLNKIFSGSPLFIPTQITPIVNSLTTEVHLVLKQNYHLETPLFGLHVIIKSSKNNDILISKIIKQEEFVIVPEVLLIDGSHWNVEVILQIPTTDDILMCQITEIFQSDIDNFGILLNFPFDFVVLIDEKTLDDRIKTILSFDENQFLKIDLVTTENKSIEQSLLDSFELNNAQISISHVINFGTESAGYLNNVIRISDEVNKYNTIIFGLNLLSLFQSYPNEPVIIYVSTEILIDGKLLKRDSNISTTTPLINPIIQAQITEILSNRNDYPVQVIQQNNVTNTIIEAKKETKLISIIQPVFIEFIKDDIIFEPKNIYFNITNLTYLKLIGINNDVDQLQLSKLTSDGNYYFDLSEFNPITSNSTYELWLANSLNIIGKGNILVKE